MYKKENNQLWFLIATTISEPYFNNKMEKQTVLYSFNV